MSKKKVKFIHNKLLWCILIAMVARTTVFVRQRSSDQFSSVDTSAGFAIILVAFAMITLAINPRIFSISKRIINNSTLYLLAYYTLCCFSFIWSLMPSFTLFRSLEVISLIGLTFVAMSYCGSFRKAETTLLQFFLLSIILGVAMKIKIGGFSIEGLHTNLYTIMAGAGFVYCYAERYCAISYRRKILSRYLYTFFLFLVIGTSAASNVATAIGLLIVMILNGKRNIHIIMLAVVVGCLLYFTGSFQDTLMQALLPNKDASDIQTMTGRTHLWSVYLDMFLREPLVGYGFSVSSRLGSMFGTVSTTNAHNGFFEVVLGTGVIGATVFVIWMVKLGLDIIIVKKSEFEGTVGVIGAFIVFFANNMSKSIIGGPFDVSLVAFLLLLAYYTQYIRYQVYYRKDGVIDSWSSSPKRVSRPVKVVKH